jgi:hypothetical protein
VGEAMGPMGRASIDEKRVAEGRRVLPAGSRQAQSMQEPMVATPLLSHGDGGENSGLRAPEVPGALHPGIEVRSER